MADAAVATPRIAKATALLLARRGVTTAASAAAAVLIARALEPTGYGAFQSAIVTWTILLSFADFGFSIALARDFAADADSVASRLRVAYRVQGALALLVALVCVGLAVASDLGTPRGMALLVLAPSILFTGLAAGRVYFTAVFDVGITVKIDIIVTLVQISAMVALAVAGAGPVGVAAAVSAGTAVAAIWIGVLAIRRTHSAGAARVRVSEIILPALPVGVVSTMSRIYSTADVAILGFMLNGAVVGQYAAAAKLLVLLNTLPSLLMSTALPGFSAVLNDEVELQRMVHRVTRWAAVAMFPPFVLAILYAGPVTRLVLGDAFSSAGGYLQVLCLAGIIGLCGQVVGTLLIASRIMGIMVWQNLAAAVFNVGMNFALVPVYGALASAWITVATEVIVVGASIVTLRRRTGRTIPVFQHLWRPCAALVPVVAVVAVWGATEWTLLVGVGLLCVMYLALSVWPDDLLPARFRGTRWTAAVD